MAEKEDYFDYVANVLGVRSLYIEDAGGGNSQAAKETIPLLVAVENLNSYSIEEKDLLEKMIAALKIDLNKIKIIDLQTGARYSSGFLLNFTEDPSIQTEHGGENRNMLTTYSPRILVQNTALKKQVWTDLQKVIQYFST